MARETLKDFLLNNFGEGARDRIAITTDQVGGVPQGSGLGIEPGTGVPLLGPGNTSLLTHYFSTIIANASNVQKFTENSSPAQSADRGDELPPADFFIDTAISSVHVKYASIWDLELEKNSNSGYFNETGLGNIIEKITGDVPPGEGPFSTQKRSAHDLLKGVSDDYIVDSPKDFVVDASTLALRSNNRFNDAVNNGFTEDSTTKPRTAGTNNLLIQTKAGEHDSDEYVTSIQKLSNVAAALMLRSTGYSTGVIPGPDGSAGAVIGIFELAVQGGFPSNRVAVGDDPKFLKRNVKGLQARTAQGAPDQSGFPAKDGGRSIPLVSGSLNAESFGNTYNHVVTFTGRGRKAHRAKAALSIIATYTLVKKLFMTILPELQADDVDTFNDLVGDVLAFASKEHGGSLPKGKSRRMAALVASSWFNLEVLTPLEVDYTQALQTGLEVMFGAVLPTTLTQDTLNDAADAAGFRAKHRYSDSPGYWSAVCDSVIRETQAFNRRIAEIDVDSFESTYETTVEIVRFFNHDNRIIKFMNVMAMIGEKSILDANLRLGATSDMFSRPKPRDPDQVHNLSSARPGKSKVGRGRANDQRNEGGKAEGVLGEVSLSWANAAVPSMYLLPVNIVRGVGRLGNNFAGPNPAASMLGSQMVRNTYTSLDVDGTSNRIPNRVVKIVEDRLDAEYVPFYFHDLRTNEIVAFHAFLTELGDSIQANYNSVTGYGRMDPVQQYVSTTRSLRVGFTAYATKREDFDEMWYKINKLVTMLYPQWSQGTFLHAGEVGEINLLGIPGLTLGSKGADFYQPFSQVIGASPIIRLRIGDVIKSNYSRFNLSRLFGIGDAETKALVVDDGHMNVQTHLQNSFAVMELLNAVRDVALMVIMAIYGSHHGLVEVVSRLVPLLPGSHLQVLGNAAGDLASTLLSENMINGYTTMIANRDILNTLRDPASFPSAVGYKNADKPYNIHSALPNMSTGYYCVDTGQQIYTTRRLNVEFSAGDGPSTAIGGTDNTIARETVYQVTINDKAAAGGLDGKKILVRHRDLHVDPVRVFNSTQLGGDLTFFSLDFMSMIKKTLAGNEVANASKGTGVGATNILATAIDSVFSNPEAYFMLPEANPFVHGFKTTKGRGLAGVIKGINFNWLDDTIPWETDFNSRAPMGCEISFDFDVIHDIAPGLGHDGYNRAPLYNVGSIMRNVSGDPYKEAFSVSELFFRRGGSTPAGSVTSIRSTGTVTGGGSA